jgi:hypothetical protein
MCQIKREVQIKAKGMFLDLVNCFMYKHGYPSARNSDQGTREEQGKELAVCSQHQLGLGAPDCPVVHRTVFGAPG